jgi:hypothetical protein
VFYKWGALNFFSPYFLLAAMALRFHRSGGLLLLLPLLLSRRASNSNMGPVRLRRSQDSNAARPPSPPSAQLTSLDFLSKATGFGEEEREVPEREDVWARRNRVF